jgi:hypothetical protein
MGSSGNDIVTMELSQLINNFLNQIGEQFNEV